MGKVQYHIARCYTDKSVAERHARSVRKKGFGASVYLWTDTRGVEYWKADFYVPDRTDQDQVAALRAAVPPRQSTKGRKIARKHLWEQADWSLTNREIAECFECDQSTVALRRKELAPLKYQTTRRRRLLLKKRIITPAPWADFPTP